MKKTLSVLLSVLLIGAVAFTGCGSEPAPAPAPEKETESAAPAEGEKLEEITVILSEVGNNLDTIDANFTDVAIMMYHVYDTILGLDEHFNVIPGVAEKFETPDEKTIVLTIGDGFMFQNGEKLEIEDVVYSIERQKDIAVSANFMNGIESIETADNTVTIHLTEANSSILRWLCKTIVVDKSYCESAGEEFASKAIGTGPYKLAEYIPGEKVVLEAWEEYPGTKANIKKITFKGISEKNAKYMAVESGDAQFTEINATDIERAKANDKIVYLEQPSGVTNFVCMNTTKAPFDNANVRRAMAYAYNKEGLAQLLPGRTVINSMVPKIYDLYYESPDVPKYDLAKAKELLEAEGYNEENPLVIEYSSYQAGDPIIAAFQAELKTIGVQLEIVNYEFGAFLQNMMNQEFQMLGGGWNNEGDPLTALACYYTGSFGDNNISFYNNPKCDELYEKARATTDENELKEINKEIEDIVALDCPIIPTYTRDYCYVYEKSIDGIETFPSGIVSFRNAVIK